MMNLLHIKHAVRMDEIQFLYLETQILALLLLCLLNLKTLTVVFHI